MKTRKCKMQIANCKLQIATACGFVLVTNSLLAQSFSFDDVQFWVGTGSKRSALVIDWVEQSTARPALVWGYRWDGTATGRDMLLAVVAADNRLFAKLGDTPGNPVRVFGLGYEADGDGRFGIDDETNFDESGIAYGSAPFFPAAATDDDDYYAEGWTFAFWHYGVASINPYDGGSWTDIQVGMAQRTLTDGGWDSWAFENSTTPPFTAFAENPMAALPPTVPGDFDRNGQVETADYLLWRSKFGSTFDLAADGNGNGIVDAADYVVWRRHFEIATSSSLTSTFAIPEPRTEWLALWALGALCAVWQVRVPNRKERIS